MLNGPAHPSQNAPSGFCSESMCVLSASTLCSKTLADLPLAIPAGPTLNYFFILMFYIEALNKIFLIFSLRSSVWVHYIQNNHMKTK